MPIHHPEPWSPPADPLAQPLPAGRWWDAVRVDAALGARALAWLGEESGAVIEDRRGAVLYWLVRPGTAGSWAVPQTAGLGTGHYVAVPPQHRVEGPGPYWRVPLSSTRYLTDAELLTVALRAARYAELGPRSLPRYCCVCARPVDEAVLIYQDAASGPGSARYAHEGCAPRAAADPEAEARRGAVERSWRKAIVHLTDCAACHATERGCETGRRLLRAHRECRRAAYPPR
ncbi:hypothetical protein LRS74_26565 [Streptomyces sp. LX-29]|uniref:hypothetical protein n=1 Tax=Streptomyces sp. LX-29 TaxID=2900152 RepID=UPI00240D73C9|nr:hypothetical protein [Streptomyces sp. LX-29]WFB10210.1 hypothetical protein LRS74_26565 [Streptomyces sp. LX-29]